ncbi:hypothetical protein DFH08DRAFT_970355 [Mycena albidolilacea]|uniref:Uncharacterized protein n=1 Tax=Mycena albidolilacea TaxID=1033008 RepID=A0AAD6ZFE7_9AGAR|nr:hypothetical protein DFH08DRAFT_970355 [Mycena albidolilacea]
MPQPPTKPSPHLALPPDLLQLVALGPSIPSATHALKIAYGMLIEDNWPGEELDWSALNAALGHMSTVVVKDSEDMQGKGKNRPQLAWAGARAFALGYVLERQYEAGHSSDAEHEHAHPAWRVGWPHDMECATAALWVLWFFEGKDTLRAKLEPLWWHIMDLLLPMVIAPFRYPSVLALPHHYTVPLLSAVHNSTVSDEHRRITVPMYHGAYPILRQIAADNRPVV